MSWGKYRKLQNFSAPIEKSLVTIPYNIEILDSARFMGTSFSNLVDNLTEGIHKKLNVGIAIVLLNMTVSNKVQ